MVRFFNPVPANSMHEFAHYTPVWHYGQSLKTTSDVNSHRQGNEIYLGSFEMIYVYRLFSAIFGSFFQVLCSQILARNRSLSRSLAITRPSSRASNEPSHQFLISARLLTPDIDIMFSPVTAQIST